jgi:hypothetical protein
VTLKYVTAHLDSDNERQISEHLKALNMTRISIAHRSEMTQGADLTVRVCGAGPPTDPSAQYCVNGVWSALVPNLGLKAPAGTARPYAYLLPYTGGFALIA